MNRNCSTGISAAVVAPSERLLQDMRLTPRVRPRAAVREDVAKVGWRRMDRAGPSCLGHGPSGRLAAIEVGSCAGFRPDTVHLQVSCPRANAHVWNRLAVTPITRSWPFEVMCPTPPSGSGNQRDGAVRVLYACFNRVLIGRAARASCAFAARLPPGRQGRCPARERCRRPDRAGSGGHRARPSPRLWSACPTTERGRLGSARPAAATAQVSEIGEAWTESRRPSCPGPPQLEPADVDPANSVRSPNG